MTWVCRFTIAEAVFQCGGSSPFTMRREDEEVRTEEKKADGKGLKSEEERESKWTEVLRG